MVSTTNLVSYWKMDEASGTRNDSHGANHLTDNNTVASVTGKINSAADFETSNSEYLSRTSNSDLQTGDIDFTFSAWINAESYPAESFIIVGKDTDSPGSSRDYTLDLYTDHTIRFYVNGGAFGVQVGSAAISLATWYHVVAWHDAAADVLGIALNAGTPVTNGTGGAVPNVSSAEFRIGARQYAGFQGYFDGLIDEVGFWKRVLSSQDRTDLYNAGAGLAYPFSAGAQDAPELRQGRYQMRQLLAQ